MEKEFFLGIDLGISTVKSALFDATGDLLGIQSDEYMIMPEGQTVEVDPEVYWIPVARTIRSLLAAWGEPVDKITAVSVSSHTETVIPLREDGRPSRKALVWMDTRSELEAQELSAAFGNQTLLEISGQPDITSLWPVTKLRWMSKNEPDRVQQTARFLLPEDYILYRLSGEMIAEQTVWSSSLLLDIRRKEISDELISFSGVNPRQIPDLYPSGTVIGRISADCAAETGLSRSTKVVSGALDQVCAAIAAENIRPGVVTESTGSVLALVATIDQPIFDVKSRVPCHIHALPGKYCLLPWNFTGGLTLKWFKDIFAQDKAAEAAAASQDVYDLLIGPAEVIPAGSDGLIMLPHLEGAFYPEFNPHARGVLFNIGLKHTRAHFTRAILEAVAFMLRRDLEGLRELGAAAEEIRVLGGGAKSMLWSQIKADVCKLPVIMPFRREAAVLGAAILAAVGSSCYPDIPSAASAMNRPGTRIEPDPTHAAIYDQSFLQYLQLYEAVKDLYR